MKRLAIGAGVVALAACGTTASMNMPMNTTTTPARDVELPTTPTTVPTVVSKVPTQHQLAQRWYKAQQVRIYLETIFYNNTVHLNNMVTLNNTIRWNIERAHQVTLAYQHRVSMQRMTQLSRRAISNRAPKQHEASLYIPRVAVVAQQGTGACGGSLPPCYVMRRESGGNLRAHNPTSTAAGKWQFLSGTWGGFGGYATADQAPESVQDARAREVWNGGRGCSAWSAC